jgi:hypothetical protein
MRKVKETCGRDQGPARVVIGCDTAGGTKSGDEGTKRQAERIAGLCGCSSECTASGWM